MKRDMDLIRYIMICLEEEMNAGSIYIADNIDFTKFSNDVTKNIVNEHLMLLLENEFIDASFAGSKFSPSTFAIKRITNKGHDFIDALRNDNVWNKVKEKATSVGGFTLSAVYELGKEYVKQELFLK